MSAPPRVSVVIPTYNGERFLAETLRAVLAQTLERTELIVVDDGSTDGSFAIAAAEAPHARRVRQPNAGVSAARNHGLRLANGEFVVFLDQDDIWHPQMLERQVAWLDAHPEHDVAVCRYQHWHPQSHGGYEPAEQLWPPLQEGADPEFTGWVHHQFLLDCWALTSGTLMRREAVLAVGGFDEALPYSEDWDLWIRLAQRSRFARLQWPTVLYRHHPVQGSRTTRDRDFRCELLEAASRRYGQASRDGRCLPPGEFEGTLSRYRAEFGRHHLQFGSRRTGVVHLWRAWLEQPRQWRWLAQALAGTLGWRPGA
jgi:glycosyltransferase involved in cell wall biosynthesis